MSLQPQQSETLLDELARVYARAAVDALVRELKSKDIDASDAATKARTSIPTVDRRRARDRSAHDKESR